MNVLSLSVRQYVAVIDGWLGMRPQFRYVTSRIMHSRFVAQGARHRPLTQLEPAAHVVFGQNGRGRVSGRQTPTSAQYRSADGHVPLGGVHAS